MIWLVPKCLEHCRHRDTSGCSQLDTRSTRHVCGVYSFTIKSTRHKSTRHRSQLETYVNLKAYTQQFNCSALGLCSRRKANISEDRLNRKAKVVCTCIFCWSCLPTKRRSLSCMLCNPSQEIILQSSRSRPSRRATPHLASYVRTVYKAKSSILLSLIHIWRCRRSTLCRSRWSPYH